MNDGRIMELANYIWNKNCFSTANIHKATHEKESLVIQLSSDDNSKFEMGKQAIISSIELDPKEI